jgi:hypothetical protein
LVVGRQFLLVVGSPAGLGLDLLLKARGWNRQEAPFFRVLRSAAPTKGGSGVKSLVSILTLGILFAFSAPAFAGKTYTTEATCEKAHMKWDANSKTCSTRSYAYHPKRYSY